MFQVLSAHFEIKENCSIVLSKSKRKRKSIRRANSMRKLFLKWLKKNHPKTTTFVVSGFDSSYLNLVEDFLKTNLFVINVKSSLGKKFTTDGKLVPGKKKQNKMKKTTSSLRS